MLKDITLGQYFPGNTLIHRLDPRTKLLMTIVYLICVFTARSPMAFGIVALYLAVVIAVSNVKLRLLFRGMKPLIFLLALTGTLNLFLTPGEPLVSFWRLSISREGIEWSIMLILRITMMVTGSFILTYTTPPMALTDGMESLMRPLKRIGVPAHELAMIMSIALRFIPTLLEETDRIMRAQKARGASFDTGNMIQRGRAMLPILLPLFISAFRRAEELAVAMESRCYHDGEGRTRMRALQYSRGDVLTGLIGLLLLGSILTLRVTGL